MRLAWPRCQTYHFDHFASRYLLTAEWRSRGPCSGETSDLPDSHLCLVSQLPALFARETDTKKKISAEMIFNRVFQSYKMVLQTSWEQRNQLTVLHARMCLGSYFFLNLCPEEVLNLIKKKKAQINSPLCGRQKTTSSCKQEPQDIKDNG